MTRETKIGMIVAGSFLCLVGIVVASKWHGGDGGDAEEQTVTPGAVQGDGKSTGKGDAKPGPVAAAEKGKGPAGEHKNDNGGKPKDMPVVKNEAPLTEAEKKAIADRAEQERITMLLAQAQVKKDIPLPVPAPGGDLKPLPMPQPGGDLKPLPLPQPGDLKPLPLPQPGPGGDLKPLPMPDPFAKDLKPLPMPDPFAKDLKPLPTPDPFGKDLKPLPTPDPFAKDLKPLPTPDPFAKDLKPLPMPDPFAKDLKPLPTPDPFAKDLKPAPAPDPFAKPGVTIGELQPSKPFNDKTPIPQPKPDPANPPKGLTIGQLEPLPAAGDPGKIAIIPPAGGGGIPSLPPISVGGLKPLPGVKDVSTDFYECQKGDSTFAILSLRMYGTDKYADALLQYNREHSGMIKNGSWLNINPPALSPGQQVLKPPASMLDQKLVRAAGPPQIRIGDAPTPIGTAPGIAAVSNPPSAGGARSYTVQNPAGENLIDISERTLGDRTQWHRIYQLNPAYPPQNRVPAGVTLKLP